MRVPQTAVIPDRFQMTVDRALRPGVVDNRKEGIPRGIGCWLQQEGMHITPP